jgi:hypothetical protein
MERKMQNQPQRGTRLIFHGHEIGGNRAHATIVTRVAAGGSLDLLVFIKNSNAQPRGSVQHLDRARESGSPFGYKLLAEESDFDWDAAAA